MVRSEKFICLSSSRRFCDYANAQRVRPIFFVVLRSISERDRPTSYFIRIAANFWRTALRRHPLFGAPHSVMLCSRRPRALIEPELSASAVTAIT